MRRIALPIIFASATLAIGPTTGAKTEIRMGTLAPADSPWHRVLVQMGQEWRDISGGEVTLRIFPGGAPGDESAMLQKARVGLLQGIAISGIGLPQVEPGVMALQIPLLFESYDELDYARERLAPELEQRILAKGFVVLNWADAGWVHFFTKAKASTPDDVRKTKLYITAGDADTEELFKAARFHPVPLSPTDMLTALQTGMIDAFDTPPLVALANQWFGLAKHMIDLPWAPLVGATIVDRKVWEKIPDAQRARLLDAARRSGERFRGEIRGLNDGAVVEMQKRGLQVVKLDDATRALWRREVEAVWPKLKDRLVPADLFDRATKLRDEYRNGRAASQ
jgi:TRAP-type C4-dicarboxylate transport system substrate-binding protein